MSLVKYIENIIRKNIYFYIIFINIYKNFPSLFPFLEKKKYMILKNSEFKNVLDIGCNNFQTMKIMKGINNKLNFFLFDPIIKNKKKIKKTKIYNLALSNKIGIKTLYMPFYKGISLDSLNSFELNNIKIYKKKYLKNFRINIKKKLVRTFTLDHYNLKSDFIKLDVEGHEYEVLIGGKKHIKKNKPTILIENNKEIKKVSYFLKSLNYVPYKILDNTNAFKKNKRLKDGDIFFFHKSKIKNKNIFF